MSGAEPARGGRPSVDELLERATIALGQGDIERAHQLAGEVLAADAGNDEAGDLLSTHTPPEGEIRRLTVLFCDVVGSTELSARMEPEAYRGVLRRYEQLCRQVVEDRYDGWIVSFRGDGFLAAFGHPIAHEDDLLRAVRAGLELLDGVQDLSAALERDGQEPLRVRSAAHRGLVFIDREAGDLYGYAVNVAARLEGLADPGTLVVSEEVRRLLGDRFELVARPPQLVKGVEEPVATSTVVGERTVRASPSAPLTGRDEELEALLELWGAAGRGERRPGECAAVVGEPGIGKSRLVAALRARVADEGGGELALRGSALDQRTGYGPVRRLVEERLGLTRRTPPPVRVERLRRALDAAGVVEHLPRLAALLELDPAAGYEAEQADPRQMRELVADAAVASVEAWTRGGPTLVVAEDVQWFDPESVDLLKRLIRSPRGDLLVVLTSRDPADAPPGDRVRVVHLGPLDRGARRALLLALGGDDLADGALDSLVDRCDGVPLFAEELLRAELAGPGTRQLEIDLSGAPAVPEILYEPLVTRLEAVADGPLVAAALAVIGDAADAALIRRVAQLPGDDLDVTLRGLVDHLVLVRATAREDRFVFRHDLLRSVAYDLQPPSRRRELHARVADALADVGDAGAIDWAVVAQHRELGGQGLEAAAAYDHAADGARQRGALAEARALTAAAVALVAPLEGPHARSAEIGLRLKRAHYAVSLEGNASAEAGQDYEHLLELSLEESNDEHLFGSLAALGGYFSARGELDRATAMLDAVEASAWRRGPAERAIMEAIRCVVTGYAGRHQEALHHAEAAIAEATAAEEVRYLWFAPLDPVSSAHTGLAVTRYVMGDVPGALAQLEAGPGYARSLPFPAGPFTLCGMLTLEAWVHIELRELERAGAALAEIEELSDRHGFDQWRIVAMTQRTVIEGLRCAMGRPDDAAAIAQQAAMLGAQVSMWKLADTWVFVTYYTTMRGVLHAAAGQTDEARAAFEESLAISRQTGMAFYDPETLRQLALLEADPDRRGEGLRRAIDLAEEQSALLYAVRAALDLVDATGDARPLEAAVARADASASFAELDRARVLLGAR